MPVCGSWSEPKICVQSWARACSVAAPRATYNFTTGTSVAAAHVSGVAALIIERNPNIDPATLEEVLFSTARDLGAPGRDHAEQRAPRLERRQLGENVGLLLFV